VRPPRIFLAVANLGPPAASHHTFAAESPEQFIEQIGWIVLPQQSA
jgi:hypothetical protein